MVIVRGGTLRNGTSALVRGLGVFLQLCEDSKAGHLSEADAEAPSQPASPSWTFVGLLTRITEGFQPSGL